MRARMTLRLDGAPPLAAQAFHRGAGTGAGAGVTAAAGGAVVLAGVAAGAGRWAVPAAPPGCC